MSGDGSPSKTPQLTWVMNNVKDVQLGVDNQIILKEDGSAWVRGNNRWGQIGNGTSIEEDYKNDTVNIPYNVLNNVSKVYAGLYFFGAIDKTGSLWTWGCNEDGRLGQGKSSNEMSENSSPKCILKNVKKVVLPTNGHGMCVAITNEGDLYIWGSCGGNINVPQKIMEDVTEVSVGSLGIWCIIKKRDASIWGYGTNGFGQLGVGNTIDASTPQAIGLNDVDKIGALESVGYAITKTGDLYIWGGKGSKLGKAEYDDKGYLVKQEYIDSYLTDKLVNNLRPTKIMSNVEKVSGNETQLFILNQKGNLYGMGRVYNYLNDIGDASKEDYYLEYLRDNVSDVIYANPDIYGHCSIWGIRTEEGLEVVGATTRLVDGGGEYKVTTNFGTTINFASENSAESVTSQELDVNTADDEKVVQYTDLNPNELYNFYQLRKNDNIQDVLEAENLLYVTQSRADANGSLEIVYTVSEEQELGDKILVGESEKIDSDLDSPDPIPTPGSTPTPAPSQNPAPSQTPAPTPSATPQQPASTSVYQYEKLADGTIRITSCQTKDVNLVIPDTIDGYTVTEIGESAFANQSSIQTIKFPAKLKQIGAKAFANCTGLTEVTLPDTIVGVGSYAFSGCTAMKKATLNNGRINIVVGMFANCTALSDVVIPDTVENVNIYAFLNCKSLKNLKLPASIKEISISAFDGAGITTVTYAGTREQWKKIKKTLTGNASLAKATITDSTGVSFAANGTDLTPAASEKVKKPAKVKITKAKNVKTKKLTVKWKKTSKAKGYQIQIASNKKFTKGKKTKTLSKTTYSFKKLKKNMYYYVRVRAYVYNSNHKKVYGSWSAVKKVKIKK